MLRPTAARRGLLRGDAVVRRCHGAEPQHGANGADAPFLVHLLSGLVGALYNRAKISSLSPMTHEVRSGRKLRAT